MNNIWYHGSPFDFDEFKLNVNISSRLSDGSSIYLTKEYKLAECYAKKIGFVYIVEIEKNNTGRYHFVQMLDDHTTKDGYECVEIFNHNELKIINKIKI